MKRNSLSKWMIILQCAILLAILTVVASSCAGINQNNTAVTTPPQPGDSSAATQPQPGGSSTAITPQPQVDDSNTFTAPQPERKQINKFISPQEAFTLIQKNQGNPYFVIIDDRQPGPFNSGHIAGAINIPISNFDAAVSSLDKNKIYLVYCPTGCGAGSSKMKDLGFKEVYDIKGGIEAWASAKLPLVR